MSKSNGIPYRQISHNVLITLSLSRSVEGLGIQIFTHDNHGVTNLLQYDNYQSDHAIVTMHGYSHHA